MKKLKFYSLLPDLILNRVKDTTWRVNDENDLRVNDEISLCYGDGPRREEKVEKARIIGVKETMFKDLTEEDKVGHEKYKTEEEMYRVYSEYYKTKIMPETRLKIIKFRLIG